jgi:hypothetical protein
MIQRESDVLRSRYRVLVLLGACDLIVPLSGRAETWTEKVAVKEMKPGILEVNPKIL